MFFLDYPGRSSMLYNIFMLQIVYKGIITKSTKVKMNCLSVVQY